MLKETITYEDYAGNTVTDTLHFNLSKKDLLDLGFASGSNKLYKDIKHMQEIAADKNATEEEKEKTYRDMFKIFLEIIQKSYGEVSEDGRRFVKDEKIQAEFLDSAAFDALLTKFVSNPDTAFKFVSAILPKDLTNAVTPIGLAPLA